MSELFSDEFLSAYLDGELSPHERAAVERWLERAPEARARLGEFRGLSRLFGDLPRSEVPNEFSTEVLHLAERRMLLPDTAPGRGRLRVRGWAVGVGISTAAAVLLTISIINVDRHGPGMGIANNPVRGLPGNQPRNVPGPAGNFAAPAQPAAVGPAGDPLLAQDDRRPQPVDQPAAVGTGGSPLPAAAPGSTFGSRGGGAPAAGVAGTKLASDSSPTGGSESDQLLQAISDEVQRVRESGTTEKYLLVVRARAVDRAEGLVLLQQVFAANNIRAEAGAPSEEKATKDDKPAAEPGSEGLYIEADADDLIASFKTTLARRHPGVRFMVEPAIELASLDVESRKQLSLVDAEQPVSGPVRGDTASRAREGKDDSDGSKPSDRADKSSKADDAVAKVNKKSTPAVASRGNSRASKANQPSGQGGQVIQKNASVHPPASNDADADAKDAPEKPDASQVANNARQVVVPVVPPMIQNRARGTGDLKAGANPDYAGSRKQESSKDDSKSGSRNSRDAKSLSPDREKMDEPTPTLVRMLIVIESEPPSPAVRADKKEPSGGAS